MKTQADKLLDWIIWGDEALTPRTILNNPTHIPVIDMSIPAFVTVHDGNDPMYIIQKSLHEEARWADEDRQTFEDDMRAEGEIMEFENE